MDKDQYTLAKERGTAWCQCISDKGQRLGFRSPDSLLTMGLLKIDPEERLSAGQCLETGADLGLFNGHDFDTGCVMPTQQMDLQGGISDDDDSTTIILGTLWKLEPIRDCR